MARIPDAEIERIKQEVSVERLVSTRVKLKRHGKDLIGLCPFHDDKEPSLVVSPDKNLWHCLGACQTGGSVIDWVMKAEGVSFRHAVELLKANAELPVTDKISKQSTVRKLPPPVDSNVEDKKLLEQVVGFYNRTLKESPAALSYLEQRGLVHPHLISFFRLGFANRTLGYRLPEKNRQAGAELRSRLQRLGVLRKSGHEHFNGSLVVPVFQEDGTVGEMYGRKITSNLRKGTPLHLYLPGPHAGVFNLSGIGAGDDVILCESLIDAMTFWCAGFRNVTASFGIEGFTKAHLEVFRRFQTQRVLIAYDRDDAGNAAAEKLASTLAGEGLSVFRILFPQAMDANEYALKMAPATKAFELVIRKAAWMAGLKSAPAFERPHVDAPAQSAPEPAVDAKPERAPALGPETPATKSGPSVDAKPAASKPEPVPRVEAKPAPAPTPTPAPTEPRAIASASAPAIVPAPAKTDVVPGGAELAVPPVDMDVRDHEVLFRFGERRVRVRGLDRNKSYDALKVNLFVQKGERFFVDTLDLYHARQRGVFIKQAAAELEEKEEVLKLDVGRVLLQLEAIQEKAIEASLQPKEEQVVLTREEREAALSLLRDPRLLDRILEDFGRLGVVGEETNKLVGYLATVSRKLDRPLAVLVQSSSAAGKSSLMEAVLAMVPDEERIKYSAMTGQSLYYLGETDLKHKILAIVEEEGAERASYALKLLQSEGELTIASTGKDPQTGKLQTNEYRVEGPVMIFLTTTAIEVDEELLNRCLVLTVDEGTQQTAAIHETQRKSRTLDGILRKKDRTRLLTLHNNAQRMLRKLPVVNPYAEQLTFSAHKTRMRRDHIKYLTLIDTIALLRQYQRETKTATFAGEAFEYVEVTADDITVANHLTRQVLGGTLDELPPQTRRLLGLLDEMVTKTCEAHQLERSAVRFSRRQVREYTGWGQTQVQLHVTRLVEMEYLLVHRGMRGQSFVYELLYEGEDGGVPRLFGLIDPSKPATTTSNLSGQNGTCRGETVNLSGSNRPQIAAKSGGVGVDESALSMVKKSEKRETRRSSSKKRTSGAPKNGVRRNASAEA